MRRWLAVLAWLLPALTAWAEEPMPLPVLEARVTDLTGTLSAGQKTGLDAALASLEREKGAQVAILLLPSTRPETIEAFGIRLAEAWKVGRRGVNDGVIVIVAKDDRKMRIEVGYGLEGAIPDALAKRIVAEAMAPRFRQGDFFGGLEAAVAALGGLIRGEALPSPRESVPAAHGEEADAAMVMLFLVVALAAMARALLGLAGSAAAAAVAGWLAWSVFATWIAVVIAAAAAFLFSFARGGGGGGLGGGSSYGGGSWSSDSGGGFSGGGGDFGGGGASGDW